MLANDKRVVSVYRDRDQFVVEYLKWTLKNENDQSE